MYNIVNICINSGQYCTLFMQMCTFVYTLHEQWKHIIVQFINKKRILIWNARRQAAWAIGGLWPISSLKSTFMIRLDTAYFAEKLKIL